MPRPKKADQTNQEHQDAEAAAAVAQAERAAAEAAAQAQANAQDAAQAQADAVRVEKTAAERDAEELAERQKVAEAAAQAQQRAADAAAAKAAEAYADVNVPAGFCQVRITALGAKEGVYTGQDRDPATGEHFPTYPKGAMPVLHRKIAEALEEKGFADIVSD